MLINVNKALINNIGYIVNTLLLILLTFNITLKRKREYFYPNKRGLKIEEDKHER